MLIRLATPTDTSSVASVLVQSFSEYKALYTSEAFAATISTIKELEYRLVEGPVWIAVERDTVVGTVSVVPYGEALLIRSLAVLPSSRGQGIGDTLLRRIESYASEKGLRGPFSEYDSFPDFCDTVV